MTMPLVTPLKAAMAANGKLHMLSVYADFPASARARWAASAIVKTAGPHWESSAEMWKLDSLAAGQAIKDMISTEAVDADVLIVAVSSLDQRATELVRWLDTLAARPSSRSTPGLLVGLLGDEEGRAKELDWTVKQLMRCAQQADRHFIWHWMGEGAMDESDWLTDSTEELMGRKLAASNEMVFC